MSSATITVTLSGSTVTLSQPTLIVAVPPTSSIAITWNATGGSFQSFAWGAGQAPSTNPTVSSSAITYTYTPPVFPAQLNQLLSAWYTITMTGGATVTGQLQVASSWAYPDSYSVNPGDNLELHVASDAPFTGVNVWPATAWSYKTADDGTPLWTVSSPTASVAPTAITFSTIAPNNSTQDGGQDWQWPQNLNVPIPSGTATGLYIAEVASYATAGATEKISMTWVMFVVKNPSPQPGKSLLYKWNINTIQAYSTALFPAIQNSSGSFASYDNDLYVNPYPPAPSSKPPNVAFQITFRRPASSMWDTKGMTYDFEFILWLQKQNFNNVDYCTDIDVELDTDLTLLSNYPCVIFRGHDEYLGAQAYDNLINYRNAGGNIAFLSGNTCCWRVNFVYDPVTNAPAGYTCNKGLASQLCDVDGPDAWWLVEPGGLDNRLVGTGSRNAGINDPPTMNPFYGSYGANSGVPQSPGYTVQNTDHWIFANTNLTEGYTIGLDDLGNSNAGGPVVETLIGYEADGAHLNDDGSGKLTYTDGTPANFALLGVGQTTPVSSACNRGSGWWVFSREKDPTSQASGIYAATMGTYSAYGSVFAASTIDWVLVLNENDFADGQAIRQPYSPATWPPPNDVNGNPVLGNPYVHYITRNVLTGFSTFQRNVAAVADLNGDGKPDLLVQSAGTGEPSYWLLDGTTRSSAGSILYDGSGAPGLTWRIAGVASLTSPTSTEIIFQNPQNGGLWYWTINSDLTRTASAGLVPADQPGSVWKLSAILNPPSGTAGGTLLFQNQQNGSLYYWQLTGTTQGNVGEFVPTFAPGNLGEILVAAVDINGDGNQELIFQAGPGGALMYWTLSGLDQASTGSITGIAPGTVVGGGTFTSGSPALLFQDTSGNLTYWTISNDAKSGSGSFSPGSNPWFLGG